MKRNCSCSLRSGTEVVWVLVFPRCYYCSLQFLLLCFTGVVWKQSVQHPLAILSFLLQAHVSSSCTLLNPRGLPWAFSRDVLLTTGWMCNQEAAAEPAGDVPMPMLMLPDHYPDAIFTNWWQRCCWLQRNVKTCQYWVLFQVSREECAVLVTGCSSSAYPLRASLTPSAPAVSNLSAS